MKYYIPKYYLSKLDRLVKQLSKKTDVVYKVHEDDTKLENAQIFVEDEYTGRVVLRNFNYVVIGVDLEINYKVGDYSIVAELEHTDAGNIIRKINENYNVPIWFRDTGCKCDHCKTNRYRKNTFLLVDKSGDYKQVGSSCLNEYTGIDAESIAEKISNIGSIIRMVKSTCDDMPEDFKDFLRESYRSYETVEDMANLFYQILLEDGYSKDRDQPFSELNTYEHRADLEDKVKKLLDVVNTDWHEDENDYCYNVSVVLKLDYIEPKHWRILLSYLWSAMKYLERQQILELERQGLTQSYLGEVGNRIEFEVKSLKILYTKWTNYTWRGEESYVYRILTTSNNVVIWSTSNPLTENTNPDRFECYGKPFTKIKATIKELNEYKGEKQTVVTRGVCY